MREVEQLLDIDGVVEVSFRENTVVVKMEYDVGKHPNVTRNIVAEAKGIVGDDYAVGTHKV